MYQYVFFNIVFTFSLVFLCSNPAIGLFLSHVILCVYLCVTVCISLPN